MRRLNPPKKNTPFKLKRFENRGFSVNSKPKGYYRGSAMAIMMVKTGTFDQYLHFVLRDSCKNELGPF